MVVKRRPSAFQAEGCAAFSGVDKVPLVTAPNLNQVTSARNGITERAAELGTAGGLMYNVRPRTWTGGRPLPDEPRDPDDHEAHSDVSGGLASRVLLDRVHGTATKEYRPPLFVKLLYWLAFQAPFPYVRNEPSLKAAKARRTIASLMTKFWFGTDHVAPTLDIRCDDKGCIFVTQLIEGQVPKDKKRARAFLRKLTPLFQEVGLPTWQVLAMNPKATGNLIETPDGSYKIIDLESGVVNPMMPIGQWIDAIKAGLIPVFDDVFVVKTRKYIEEHRDEIEVALGPEGLRELEGATDEYQDCAEVWQKSELRIWGKLLQLVLKAGSFIVKPLRRA